MASNSGLRLNNRPADLGPLAGSIILRRCNLSNTSQNRRTAYTGYQTLALTVQLIATEGASKT